MKFSVSIRQPDEILALADEIFVQYHDVDGMYDRIEKFPDKSYVVAIYLGDEVNWGELKAFAEKVDLTIAAGYVQIMEECKRQHLKFYSGFNISTYSELRKVVALGVSQAKIGSPLYFDIKEIKRIVGENIGIRLNVNMGNDTLFPTLSCLREPYVRPEDLELYADYVDVVEFSSQTREAEAMLLKVYKVEKQWKGNLKLLIHGFTDNIDNRALPDEFGKARLQCRQNCMRNGACRFCDTAFGFATAINNNKGDWTPGVGFKA